MKWMGFKRQKRTKNDDPTEIGKNTKLRKDHGRIGDYKRGAAAGAAAAPLL